jgi:hypothetical protein
LSYSGSKKFTPHIYQGTCHDKSWYQLKHELQEKKRKEKKNYAGSETHSTLIREKEPLWYQVP